MVSIRKDKARYFMLLCMSILFSSCCFFMSSITELEVRKKVVLKWQGEDTGIRKLLDIDGYFVSSYYIGDSCVKYPKYSPDSFRGVAFFEDGTYINFSSIKNEEEDFKELIYIYESGVYTLSNDTIVVEAFQKFDYLEKLEKGLYVRFPILRRFKIIDRNTFEVLDAYNLYSNLYYNGGLVSTFGKYVDDSDYYNRVVYSFSNTYSFPTSDIKMKNKEWLWEKKEDWEKWMVHRKEQNKKILPYKIIYED